jgi:hypothetical protein
MLQIRANLATLEARRGHYPEAARILEEVIAAQERLLGADHPSLGLVASPLLRGAQKTPPERSSEARAGAGERDLEILPVTQAISSPASYCPLSPVRCFKPR